MSTFILNNFTQIKLWNEVFQIRLEQLLISNFLGIFFVQRKTYSNSILILSRGLFLCKFYKEKQSSCQSNLTKKKMKEHHFALFWDKSQSLFGKKILYSSAFVIIVMNIIINFEFAMTICNKRIRSSFCLEAELKRMGHVIYLPASSRISRSIFSHFSNYISFDKCREIGMAWN